MTPSPLSRGRLESWSVASRCATALAATLSLAVWWPAPAASETLVVNGRQVLGAPVPLEYPDGVQGSSLSADRAFLYVEHGSTLSIVDTRLWTVLSRPSIAAQFPDRVFFPLYVGLSAVVVRPHPVGVFVTVVDLASGATRNALIPRVDVSCVWGEMGYSTTERRVVFATRTELVAV